MSEHVVATPAAGPGDHVPNLKKRLANLVEVFSFLSMAVVVIGAFGKWHFALDLASHFRIQATLALFVASPLLYRLERKRWAIVSLLAAVGLAATLWPFWVPSASSTPGKYRLLAMNVLTENLRHDQVVQYIREVDPDFILLQETNSTWLDSLDAALATTWRHSQREPRGDNFGIVLYSKLPWKSCEIVEYTNQLSTPSVNAQFRLPDGSDLRLMGTHPLPPMNNALWSSRNAMFAALAKEIRDGDGSRTILAGDLNCTPWSYWFRRLLRESQLRNSAIGNGLSITWTPIRLAVCGLPIDHVLVGSDIRVSRRLVGPYLGSDHRPVVIDFD